METHVILGAGGVIGNGIVRELEQRNVNIKLAGRSHRNTYTHPFMKTDLTDPQDVYNALEGADTAYLTAGLKYDTKIWQRDWPIVMENCIQACLTHGTKLIFFDNAYMYGLMHEPMTEKTAYNPSSKKGDVRAEIAARFMEEVNAGNLTGMITRSAGFYGPGAENSFTHHMIFKNLQSGKKAQWMGRDDVPHSLTYTPDASKAVVTLAFDASAWNQIWHLPTAAPPLTGKELIEKAASVLGTEPRYTVLKPWMVKMAGWFNPMAKESAELLYQNTHPYIFDSSKFEQAFYPATPYEKGIEETLQP